MLFFRNIFDQIYLIQRPLILVNSNLSFQFDLKGMKLSNFQKLIFFWVASFNADAKPILFREVIDINYLQS